MVTAAELKAQMSIPVIGSPLFIISCPELVIAQCKAGVVGSFPSLNARPIEQFEEWLMQISTELEVYKKANPDKKVAPYAVNLIVHKTNNRLVEDLELCVKYKVPIIITSLGARTDVNDAIHSYGGIVLHDIINTIFARKALDKGADGLIAVAAGAGGHAGTLSPLALIQDIREFHDGILCLSGCIATGRNVYAAQAMGADFAYIGTPFIATKEARAVDGYKEMITESDSNGIIYSSLFTGVSGNYLAQSVANAGLDPNNLPEGSKDDMSFASGGSSDAKAWRDIWGSGQGIGAVKEVLPAAQYIAKMQAEYEEVRKEMAGEAALYA